MKKKFAHLNIRKKCLYGVALLSACLFVGSMNVVNEYQLSKTKELLSQRPCALVASPSQVLDAQPFSELFYPQSCPTDSKEERNAQLKDKLSRFCVSSMWKACILQPEGRERELQRIFTLKTEPALDRAIFPGVEVYRLIINTSFSAIPTRVLRVERFDGRIHAVSKLYVNPHMNQNPTVLPQSINFPLEDWHSFMDRLNQYEFWSRPPKNDRFGCDGYSITLEGMNGSRYHVVERWVPEEPLLLDIVDLLVDVAPELVVHERANKQVGLVP